MLPTHAAWTPWAFMSPALVVLGTFVIFAFAQVVYLSLHRVDLFASDASLLSSTEFVGFENYQRVLGGSRFWWCLLNSAIYLLVTPAIMVVSLGAALAVAGSKPGMRPMRVLLFLPVVTPTIVASLAWRELFRENGGMINSALTVVGLDPVPWLTSWPWALVTAMTVTLWKGFGYYMMIFVAGLMAVPKELEEASSIDGCGKLGTFFNVTLPSIRPVLALVAVISSISAIKVFDEIFVTVRGIPTTSKTVVPLLFDVAFEDGSFGAACAIGVCLFLILLGFSIVNLRLSQGRES